jgi:hypothetical protein
MQKKRRGPNLFEVMNKAHLNQPAVRRGGWLSTPSRQNGYTPVTTVAQALTEEEAAAELASARIAAEKAKLEQEAAESTRMARAEQRLLEKEELRRAKQAAKLARLEAKQRSAEERDALRLTQMDDPDASPSPSLPITASTLMALAGLVAVVAIVGFSLGRGAGKPADELPKAAAVIPAPKNTHLSPRLPKIPDTSKTKEAGRQLASGENPNLSHLVQKPSSKKDKQVVANQPLASGEIARTGSPNLPENLNYLQIESFLISRDRSGEQVGRDVAEARKFLGDHGVRTFARRKSNGYVLFAEQGFEPAKDAQATRDAFRHKIEALGLEFRRSGGLYQFKGCLFVSYAATQTGDPA